MYVQNRSVLFRKISGQKCDFRYTVFRASRVHFFLVNRVENQNEPKRPQSGGRLGSFWFSTRPTAMGGTDYNGLGL